MWGDYHFSPVLVVLLLVVVDVVAAAPSDLFQCNPRGFLGIAVGVHQCTPRGFLGRVLELQWPSRVGCVAGARWSDAGTDGLDSQSRCSD